MACGLGVAALAWLVVSLIPGAGMPAWPSATLGAMALFARRPPGRGSLRAIAGITGSVALVGALVEFALIWTMAALLRH
ncbi:MAG: hypothetical protein V3V08_17740 [Nannocystaceae bacterium]